LNEVFKYFNEQFDLAVTTVYQNLCQEILRVKLKECFRFNRIGRWWDVIGKVQYEIDLVALDEDNNQILFGESKWSNKKVGSNIFKELKEKSRFVNWNINNRKEKYILFSKSGFTHEIMELARIENNLILVEKDKKII